MNWHIDQTMLRRYAAAALSDAGMASVELHVTGCPTCRALVAGGGDHAARDRVKEALDARLDTQGVSRIERVFGWLGLDEPDARLLAATTALRGSWVVASSLALAFAVLATFYGHGPIGLATFLVVAPLVPLAGVGLAYGPRVDPTFEIATAATLPGIRVLLLRTLAVAGPALPVLVMLSLFLPIRPLAFAWLLPALGLAAASLALGTVMPLSRAATLLAGLWTAIAAFSLAGAPRTDAEAFVRGFPAFRPSGQLLFAALAAASLALMALRRAEFESVK